MANIYLIGMMGVGKTTIGRKLAKLLGESFIDTDQELEKRNGVTVGHIFDIEGEEGFRKRETKLLAELATQYSGVVATGGGMVTQSENRKLLSESGDVVYLRASLGTLWSRLRNCHNRPLLQTENPKEKLRGLLIEREPMYTAAANYVVPVGKGTAFQMAKRIQHSLNEHS